MKKLSSLLCSLFLLTQGICMAPGHSAADRLSDADLLVGQIAPHIDATAIVNNEVIDHFTLFSFWTQPGHYTVLLFYPLDFTFVCPTELLAFQERLNDFKQRNAQVIACSVDSAYSHLAWLNTPRSMGGIQGVTYPLLSDLDKTIASAFNVLDKKQGIAYRGLFLIDPLGIIRYQVVNDLPIGRSVDETLRVLDALIMHVKCGDVCPANWHPGDETFAPTLEGVIDYLN